MEGSSEVYEADFWKTYGALKSSQSSGVWISYKWHTNSDFMCHFMALWLLEYICKIIVRQVQEGKPFPVWYLEDMLVSLILWLWLSGTLYPAPDAREPGAVCRAPEPLFPACWCYCQELGLHWGSWGQDLEKEMITSPFHLSFWKNNNKQKLLESKVGHKTATLTVVTAIFFFLF